ncbi:hypothetical protein Dimus_009304 [Dionaea muscipula]
MIDWSSSTSARRETGLLDSLQMVAQAWSASTYSIRSSSKGQTRLVCVEPDRVQVCAGKRARVYVMLGEKTVADGRNCRCGRCTRLVSQAVRPRDWSFNRIQVNLRFLDFDFLRSKFDLREKNPYSGKKRTLKAWRRKEVSVEVPADEEQVFADSTRKVEPRRVSNAKKSSDKLPVAEHRVVWVIWVHDRLVITYVYKKGDGSVGRSADDNTRSSSKGQTGLVCVEPDEVQVCTGRRARVYVMLGEKSQLAVWIYELSRSDGEQILRVVLRQSCIAGRRQQQPDSDQ